jgi:hypothetical protein
MLDKRAGRGAADSCTRSDGVCDQQGRTPQFVDGGGSSMKIEYFHASKFGNGAMVAEEFKKQMTAMGVDVEVHHIREVPPSHVPPADLYLFSSPGRFGKPIRGMRRFLQALSLPAGTRYAVFTTEAAPKPDKRTRQMPTEEELVRMGQRVRPVMNEILQDKGLVEIAEGKVYVTKLKGPLEDGWQEKVKDFTARLPG